MIYTYRGVDIPPVWQYLLYSRLARQFTMREDILTVEEGYLGNLGELVELSPKMYNRSVSGRLSFCLATSVTWAS